VGTGDAAEKKAKEVSRVEFETPEFLIPTQTSKGS